ncbi:MAG: bile acid:sodium symporter, partial [Planctomycetota bacterium]
VVPFWLWVGVASGLLGSPVQDPLTVTDSVSIAGATDAAVTGVSWTTQFWKLACMVLLPLVLGQCLRRIGLAGIADRFKRQISFLAQIGILCIVLLGTIGLRLNLDADANLLQDIAGLVLVLIVVAGIHTLVLWMGIQISAAIGCSQEKQIAVGISGSQKTLMIGLQIAIDAGASLLPMMLYHACQLLIDTPIADAWRRRHSDSQSPSNVPSSSNPLPTTDAPHPNHPTPP